MPGREVKFLNDWSGGLNSNSDPKDLDDSQQHSSNNIDYRTSGQIKPLGNPTFNTVYDTVEATIVEGKGLFSYNSPYSIRTLTASGSSGISFTSEVTQQPHAGEYPRASIWPGSFSFDGANQSVAPIYLSGFMWKSGTFEQSVSGCSWDATSSGVLVNHPDAGQYTPHTSKGASQKSIFESFTETSQGDNFETIEVDGTNATTKFSIGDEVWKYENSQFIKIGTATRVESTYIEVNSGGIKDTYPIGKDGNFRGISQSLDNNATLYNPTTISCSADMTGATLLVPGLPIDISDNHTDIPPTETASIGIADGSFVAENPFTKIVKVRHKELAVNGDFASTPSIGTGNAQWTHEANDTNYNLTITHDTSGKGYEPNGKVNVQTDVLSTSNNNLNVTDSSKMAVGDVIQLTKGSTGRFNQSQPFPKIESIDDSTTVSLVGNHSVSGAVRFHVYPGENTTSIGKANSMKLTLTGATKGVVWYKMTDCVVGKEYSAEIMTHSIGMSANDITKVRMVAHSSATSAVNAWVNSNVSFYSSDNTTFDKYMINRVSFIPTNATYYVGVCVEGADTKVLYCDNFSVQSRWFVDRFTVSRPLVGAHSSQTIKVAKVLFHDLNLYHPGVGFGSTPKRNWLGLPSIQNTSEGGGSNLEFVTNEADYQTMFNEIVDLINGTNEQVSGVGYNYNLALDYGNDSDDWIKGFAGNCSSNVEASNPGNSEGSYLHTRIKTIGTSCNGTQIMLSPFVNQIRYDCRGLGHGTTASSSYPTAAPFVKWQYNGVSEQIDGPYLFDYFQYDRPLQDLIFIDSDNDGLNNNSIIQKNILNQHNGHPPHTGLEFLNTAGPDAFTYAQESLICADGGIAPRVQNTSLFIGGALTTGDILKVTVDGAADKVVTVTADASPTLTEISDNSTGLTAALNADSEITPIFNSAYNGAQSDGRHKISCVGVTAGTSYSLSYETFGASTEYIDDKHICLLDKNAKFTFNSSVGEYQWSSFVSAGPIWSNTANTIDPIFYSDGGKLRISDGNFSNDNPTKGFRYISQMGLFKNHAGIGSGLDITRWTLNNNDVSWYNIQQHNPNALREDMYSAMSPGDEECHVKFEIDVKTLSGTPTFNATDGTVTFTSTAHGLSVGDDIDIVGTDNYDGRYEILENTSDTFKVETDLESDPSENVSGHFVYPVGYWDETYKFYASAYDMDGNETLPEHSFLVASGVKELSLPGRKLKIGVQVDPGDAPGGASVYNESDWITPWQYRGFRLYYSKSEDGFGEKWHLGDIDFKKGFVRTDNGDVFGWKREHPTGHIVQPNFTSLTGDGEDFTRFSAPVDVETYESLNGYSSKNDSLVSKYKHVAILGRRAYIGNLYYDETHYNDRMIVSPYNMLDVFPTPYNVIEVTVNDGQAITGLVGFGDRLLQFKNQYLYIINVASGEPSTFHLEASHRFYGCRKDNHVVETEKGIIWANSIGVYMYNGQPDNIIDLLSYKPKEDIKEARGIGEDERNSKRISTTTWNEFYNDNMIVGYDPVEKLVIFKRSTLAEATSGDCYIYDLQSDLWTFATAKWANGVKTTNYVTDLDENLITISESNIAFSNYDGGEIRNKAKDNVT
tara:strand:+ start:2174 stop:6943 length:4770 start_codon:yes stop_codon:yes gene_type:complete